MKPRGKVSVGPGARLPRRIREELERAARPSALEDACHALESALQAREDAKPSLALKFATRAKECAPRAASVREILGMVQFEAGAWRDAVQELLTYRRLSGDHRRDPVIASCYRLAGDPKKSLTFLASLDQASIHGDVWASAQIERARAYAASGRVDFGLELLRSERRGAPAARGRRLDEAINELTG